MALFKQKQPEMMEMANTKKELLPVPTPHKELPKFEEPTARELLEMILNNTIVIHNILEKMNQPVMALDDEELKYVPEEDKEEYFALKEGNPKLAEKLLAGYKAEKKR